jgi:hypothetical protein
MQAVDQHGLTGPNGRDVQRLVRGEPGPVAPRTVIGTPRRDQGGCSARAVNSAQLPPGQQLRGHRVAGLEPPDAWADRHDHPGRLHAERHGGWVQYPSAVLVNSSQLPMPIACTPSNTSPGLGAHPPGRSRALSPLRIDRRPPLAPGQPFLFSLGLEVAGG